MFHTDTYALDNSNTPGEPLYPRLQSRPPKDYSMIRNSSSAVININTGNQPTLLEALNATAQVRYLWLAAIDDELESLNAKYI